MPDTRALPARQQSQNLPHQRHALWRAALLSTERFGNIWRHVALNGQALRTTLKSVFVCLHQQQQSRSLFLLHGYLCIASFFSASALDASVFSSAMALAVQYRADLSLLAAASSAASFCFWAAVDSKGSIFWAVVSASLRSKGWYVWFHTFLPRANHIADDSVRNRRPKRHSLASISVHRC